MIDVAVACTVSFCCGVRELQNVVIGQRREDRKADRARGSFLVAVVRGGTYVLVHDVHEVAVVNMI
jgi:hypothetical protein